LTSRRKLRELIFKLLFEMEVGEHDAEPLLERFIITNEIPVDGRKFFRSLVRGVVREIRAIDGIVEEYAEGWKITRIARADLTILRLAIFEMLFGLSGNEADKPVVINEAILLAKKFSGSEASRFINGILGSVSRDMKNKSKTVGRIAGDNVLKK